MEFKIEILVAAASSLTDVLKEIAAAFQKANPRIRIRFTFGASGTLLQQIQAGAPVDVFISASPKEMDTLEKAGRLLAGTRANIAGNRLVLIVPASGSRVTGWVSLVSAPGRIALSNPDSVPSGRYARETLTRRKLWDAVAKKGVYGGNVRQTLAYVAGGNVAAGVVFATDAKIEARRVRVVATATPGKDHAPIVYPASILGSSRQSNAARRFLTYLRTPAAQAVFRRFGFTAEK
jgi:molybdate transport system substrate-binding protein